MKKLFLILLLIPAFCFAQNKTEKNLGLDPATGQPGYVNLDTFRTVYYHSPLYTIGDTVYSDTSHSGGGQWTLKGNNIFNSNSGKVGINDTVPRAQLEVTSPTNTTTLIDSTGIFLSTPFLATSGQNKSPGPIVFVSKLWNASSGKSVEYRFRIGVIGGEIYFQSSSDSGATYGNLFHSTGGYTIFDGPIQGSSGSFSSSITAQGLNSNGNNMFNSNGGGQTPIGKTVTNYPSDPAAIAMMYSNGIQGFLLPSLTKAQRDSIGWTVSSITVTNGGSGYTWASIDGNQHYLNPSAPKANGVQSWGGNYVTGSITISGGVITSIAVVHGGYFNGAIGLGFTGDGTGAAATATMARLLPDGLEIYCTDCVATDASTGVVQVWQNSSQTWKNAW